VGVDFYFPRMYPYGCKNYYSTGYLSVLTSTGTALTSNLYVSDSSYNNFAYFQNLAAGTYQVTMQMSSWDTNDVKDYTVRVYGAGAATIA